MTQDTKRVDELEIGDSVIPQGCKGVLTVSSLEKITSTVYAVKFRGIEEISFLDYCEKLTYLGNNKKEEEIMKTQKVDYTVLYPYFDSLTNDEATFQHTNIPVYVRQQLKNIHELFEGVFGLTLEEVKSLYFERKMSKQESLVEKSIKTKKAKDLCIGDKVFICLPDLGHEEEGAVTQLYEYSPTQIKIFIGHETVAIYNKSKELTVLE